MPVWPNVYGVRATRQLIAGANLLNTLVLATCALVLDIHPLAHAALLSISLGILALAVLQLFNPTRRRNWMLFKFASLYMMASSLLLAVGVLV